MAVAKRPAACAAALGIAVADATDKTDPGIVEATRLLAIGKALVCAYLRGGDCPDVIRDEAVIRVAGHVKDRRTFGIQEGRLKPGAAVQMDLSPAAAGSVRQSGAGALLAPWVRRSA